MIQEMDENLFESTFCYKYLSNFVGLKITTIKTLVDNDYDTLHSLMAMDLDIDLNQLPNVLMGQKSILREALIKLKKEFNVFIKNDSKSGPFVDHSIFNSTPKITKDYPFVANDRNFNEFMSTVIGSEVQTNVSSNADNDSQLIKLSPIRKNSRRGRPSIKSVETSAKIKPIKSVDTTENTENSKPNQSLDKIKTRKRQKKYLHRYTLKRSNRNRISPKTKPSIETKTNSERKIFIDIDKMEESTGNASNTLIDDISQSEEVISLNESQTVQKRRKTNGVESWKPNKQQIIELIKNKSNKIQLKDAKTLFSEQLKDFFKLVQMDGNSTPFAICDLCISSGNYRLISAKSSINMKNHLTSKWHKNDTEVKKMIETGWLKKNRNDSDSSDPMESQTQDSQNPSLEELAKLVSEPDVVVSQINISFDKLSNKYMAQLIDRESQNSSQVVINNYNQIFKKTIQPIIDDSLKVYNCQFKDCSFSAVYPFSLQQHIDNKHKKPITDLVTKKDYSSPMRSKSFSYINGMNAYVVDYMKKKSINSSTPV